MAEEPGPQRSWWQTIPGLLAAAAGVITAITGLIVALHQVGIWEKKREATQVTVASPPPTSKEAGKDQPTLLPMREEKESNDDITTANPIALGATIRGRLATDKDRDFFTFRTSSQSADNIRVILRKRFFAEVEVYDAAERRVAARSEVLDRPVSFSFRSEPESSYYIVVKHDVTATPSMRRGDYELVVRQE